MLLWWNKVSLVAADLVEGELEGTIPILLTVSFLVLYFHMLMLMYHLTVFKFLLPVFHLSLKMI